MNKDNKIFDTNNSKLNFLFTTNIIYIYFINLGAPSGGFLTKTQMELINLARRKQTHDDDVD